jgi:hypothetical protein
VAIGGKVKAPKRRRYAKTVAAGCHRLPRKMVGKGRQRQRPRRLPPPFRLRSRRHRTASMFTSTRRSTTRPARVRIGVSMLSFLTAEEASMEAFLSVSAASPYQPQLREYAHSLLEQRCTRPDWCLLGFGRRRGGRARGALGSAERSGTQRRRIDRGELDRAGSRGRACTPEPDTPGGPSADPSLPGQPNSASIRAWLTRTRSQPLRSCGRQFVTPSVSIQRSRTRSCTYKVSDTPKTRSA